MPRPFPIASWNSVASGAVRGVLFTALIVLTACEAKPVTKIDTVALREELRASQLAWGQAWKDRDAAAILAHYASDAVLYVPGAPPSRGAAVFTPFVQAVVSDPNFSLSWTVDDVRVAASGDMGSITGAYRQHTPSKTPAGYVVETGHYVTVFERRNGHWLAVSEINTPGPASDQAQGL